MPVAKPDRPKRVAISLEMDWAYKRHTEIYAGCMRYADEAGWICNINPAVDRVLRGKDGGLAYDGVIARVTRPLGKAILEAGVPTVNVWMNSPVRGLPSVYPDWEMAGAMAAEHLMGRGFRHLGYLGYDADVDSQLLLRGYGEAVARRGGRLRVCRFSRTSVAGFATGWDGFVARLEAWIGEWEAPIGVFVCADLICRYLIDVCRSKNLHISQDVAIVGAHNETEICGAPPPSLTSIDMGYGRVGYRAAALLDQLMQGGQPPDGPEFLPPAELIPRQSTDAFASEDPLVARALRFIAENSHRRMQVKDVATAVAATRRTLERRFRASVGRTIAEEITRLRMERAKRRMVETDAPMKDVATDSGFRNADHFYKVFARVEGVPPTIYRERHQHAYPERV